MSYNQKNIFDKWIVNMSGAHKKSSVKKIYSLINKTGVLNICIGQILYVSLILSVQEKFTQICKNYTS